MTFGITAAGWLAIGTAAAGVAAGADAKRKAGHATEDAQRQMEAERLAAQRAATERSNAKIVEASKRKRAQRGLLALGVDDQSLGTDGKGQTEQSQRRALLSLGASYATGTASGSAGANMPGAYYRERSPTKPSRESAV